MSLYLSRRRVRYSFGEFLDNADIPNLIKVQRESYENFLQTNIPSDKRKKRGLEEVLSSVFRIEDKDQKASLEYVSYDLGDPKYDPSECIQRGMNYSVPLKVVLRLVIWDEGSSGARDVQSVKEQEIYIGDVPLMTDNGTFIINGAQRVVVSQLHRSPGVFYTHDYGKHSVSGKYLYSARIIPYRGSWLDFEFDVKDILYFRIDRKRKIPVTTLLKALGYSKDDILKRFYSFLTCSSTEVDDVFVVQFDPVSFRGKKLDGDVFDSSGSVVLRQGDRVTPRVINNLSKKSGDYFYNAGREYFFDSYLACDIIDSSTGEILHESASVINSDVLADIKRLGLKEFKILNINNVNVGSFIRDTLFLDKNKTQDQALADIYKVLRPGEPSTPDAAKQLFDSIFFDHDKYDLSVVGRMKINHDHGLGIDDNITVLTKDDIVSVVSKLVQLKSGNGSVDDIDSLGNRRVRSAGELVENQFRMGLVKIQRSIVERISSVDIDSVMPGDLVNSKALVSSLREFFGISQLSQFMAQTNPLSEITHKRRLSALGPGGLSRDRAGFEVRDVHVTHYSRICPIETPEGQNIGLISSLATYADINKYGFIESPYRVVKDAKITDKIVKLSAVEEENYNIASANTETDQDGFIKSSEVLSHRRGEMVVVKKEDIHFADVSPQQLVSVAASLIPFLENDDANRALMGSNMQRQAVPLIKSDAPFVGTGMESVVSRDSGAVILAKNSGVVDYVCAKRIVVKVKKDKESDVSGVDIYTLIKYDKSNQGTCINQRPIVRLGDFVNKGDIIADGPSVDKGELALGKNILAAFLPWNGYNFEDSILLSERLVKDDVFTSIHIKEYEVVARDTRLGPEEITRDLPNVSDADLLNIDEFGIINVGSKVNGGDILVSKVTPSTESLNTPEEKLLSAIFGEKAANVKNASLRMPPGEKGVVVGVRVFTKRGVEKDGRALSIERNESDSLLRNKEDEIKIIEDYLVARLRNVCEANSVAVDKKLFSKESFQKIFSIQINNDAVIKEFRELERFYKGYVERLEAMYKDKINKLQSGDDLPQGVLKIVKVYVADKLKIQPGDKIAGRHGNKGIVSKIVPVEDMPFLEDGTPVDMLLNPLGVPSRMNIGQVLETHLGWASVHLGKKVSKVISDMKSNQLSDVRDVVKEVLSFDTKASSKMMDHIDSLNDNDLLDLAFDISKGVKFATPVFDGAKEKDINYMLKKAGLDDSGQVLLRDGRTGEFFDKKVTVGYIYMMKLDHLVDSKIHARSTGPYSLVTQQPLGGKSHFGGQRVGEMECWALQAYGAAYTLQEMLTVKSDDVEGRVRVYESIIRGDVSFEVGLPESFQVMVKEIRSLGLNIEVHKKR